MKCGKLNTQQMGYILLGLILVILVIINKNYTGDAKSRPRSSLLNL